MSEHLYPNFIGGPNASLQLPLNFPDLSSLPPRIGNIGDPPHTYHLILAQIESKSGFEQWYFYQSPDITREDALALISQHIENRDQAGGVTP